MEAYPQPASDDALRSSIAERFAGAYEAQLGYLARVHADEQQKIQADIGSLRNAAYMAQHSAAQDRARADAARQVIGVNAISSAGMRQALSLVRGELASEQAALAASRSGINREEHALAQIRSRGNDELAELAAQCNAAQQRRIDQENRATELLRSLAIARQDRQAEAEIAKRHEQRFRAATGAREQALHTLKGHEELAVRTLKEAVDKFEKDFAEERHDFKEREKRARAQIQEYEQHLEQRRLPVGSSALQIMSMGRT